MKRYCAHCKTPITAHVLVVDDRDFHRKSCYCWFSRHKVEGDRSKPEPCRICEPRGGGSTKVKPQRPDQQRALRGRRGRAVMLVS